MKNSYVDLFYQHASFPLSIGYSIFSETVVVILTVKCHLSNVRVVAIALSIKER